MEGENGFNQSCDIFKVDSSKHIVYGKALVPNKFDSQGDIISKEDVELAAHNFLIGLQKSYEELSNGALHKADDATAPDKTRGQIGFMHTLFKGIGGFGYVVESYIDPSGSWVLGTKVTDNRVWDLIQKGEITGYSIGGSGYRTPITGGEK